MGKDLAEKYPVARQTFEEADEALGYKLSTCFRRTGRPASPDRDHAAGDSDSIDRRAARARDAHSQALLRRRAQSGRIFRARGLGHVQLRRRRPHRAQSRQVHAGSRAGRRGRDGRNPGHGRGDGHRRLPRRGARRSLRAGQHQFAGADRHLRQHSRSRARREAGRRTRRQSAPNCCR
jgi:hypothetical protein